MNRSIECHGNDLAKTIRKIQSGGGLIESIDASVGGNPGMWSVNYFDRSEARLCYSCKASGATHEIREMSKRSGNYLCDNCWVIEDNQNRAMNWLHQ